METFNYGDRVQVFDLKKFECLGWGSVTETYIKEGQKKQSVLVCLDTGESIYAGGATHTALSKDKAVEVANRMLKDIEKAG